MEEDILLKLENVEICREENRVLHDACLTLRNGEFVYVIGKVGSGKSSLLKSLYCEIPILRGEARIMDYNLTKMKRKDIPYLRRKLGIVFQDFQFRLQESGIRAESHRMEKEKRDQGTDRQRAPSGRHARQRL